LQNSILTGTVLFVTYSSADGEWLSALFSEKTLEDLKTYRKFAAEI
jgi:hypothetical protein